MELDQFFTIERYSVEKNNRVYSIEQLTCNCLECNYYIENKFILSNPICLNHIFKIIKKIEIKNINKLKIITPHQTYILNYNQIQLLKDYIKFVTRIFNIIESKEILPKNNNCEFYNNCKKRVLIVIKKIIGNLDNSELFKSPIQAYKELKLELSVNISNNLNKCKKCLLNYTEFIEYCLRQLEQTQIIGRYNKLDKENKKFNSFEEILKDIFDYSYELSDTITTYLQSEKFDNKIESYKVGPFKISIYMTDDNIENLYLVSWPIFDQNIQNIIDWILNELENIDLFNNEYRFYNFNHVLKIQINKVSKLIDENFTSINEKEKSDLILWTVFKFSGFPLLFPFLMDDNIEEIYLDKCNSYIYIDHRKYGRCKSNISLSEDEIQRFITRVRIESNKPLDEMHPSLKAEIITDYFQIRVTILIKPLATNNYIIMIRKLKKRIFSILDLISNGTISIDAASYLIFLLYHKRNIIVIGAPGSGKTTLINALDLLTPNHWRKIYIEDVIESIDQENLGKHQIKISTKIDSNNFNNKFYKEFQVRESLHRTPDLIYLGEMISKSSVNAYFFLLKVGLRCGLCTSHGENPELIIERWIIDDGISITSIKDIDTIVQISKINDVGQIKRRIIQITELDFLNHSRYKLINLFERDPSNDRLCNMFDSLKSLYELSPVINKIKKSKIENLSYEIFNNEFMMIKIVLQKLLEKNEFDIQKLNLILNKMWIMIKKYSITDWALIKKEILKLIEGGNP